MEKSDKKEIVQVYMNNLVKAEDEKTDKKLRVQLLENNRIIVENYDDIEEIGAFAELFSLCSKEMHGILEPTYRPSDSGLDIYDVSISMPLDLGMLIDNDSIY